ncbi:MAG TPA: helix-turn-helix domain-containing protein [Pirellulales bacterium]
MDRNASVPFLMVAISNKIVASASQAYMRHYQLGIMEWRVMALLAADPGITGKDISLLSGVTAGSVSRAINVLKKLRYLDVSSDAADNRRNFLRLNSAGMALHDRIIVSALEREALLLTSFSQAERRRLLSYLRRLLANIALVCNADAQQLPRLSALQE